MRTNIAKSGDCFRKNRLFAVEKTSNGHLPGAVHLFCLGGAQFIKQLAMLKHLRQSGPAMLVAAAFIGPGTVTVCSLAGRQFGYGLLWALLFSVIATIVLQEMAARLGIISGSGLSEALRTQISQPALRAFALLLVFSAILIGNSAYEAGNISGGVLGMEELFGPLQASLAGRNINLWSLLIGLLAGGLVLSGSYKLLEKTLIFLVGLMGLVFVFTAAMSDIDFRQMLEGLFMPRVPAGGWLTVLGLIGTTIVPYNLFLHASSAARKWKGEEALKTARLDTITAISLGGLVSMAIVVSSAALRHTGGEIQSAADLARQLEPLLGLSAKYFLSLGLFAAGISSAITAPLAAAWAATGIRPDKSPAKRPAMQRPLFKGVALAVLATGLLFSALGYKPVQVIRFAQAANGLLLPFIAAFLLWAMNRKKLLGKHVNSNLQNILGIAVLLVSLLLSLKMLGRVF